MQHMVKTNKMYQFIDTAFIRYALLFFQIIFTDVSISQLSPVLCIHALVHSIYNFSGIPGKQAK